MKTPILTICLLATLIGFTTGCSPTFFGKWDADTSDKYPSLSITRNSSYVTVVLISGRVGWDVVSYSGVLDAPAGDGKTGWTLEGKLEGDTAMQGRPSVKIQIDPDGKTGTVWWRGSSYKIKRS
jgi:hypothetical protein